MKTNYKNKNLIKRDRLTAAVVVPLVIIKAFCVYARTRARMRTRVWVYLDRISKFHHDDRILFNEMYYWRRDKRKPRAHGLKVIISSLKRQTTTIFLLVICGRVMRRVRGRSKARRFKENNSVGQVVLGLRLKQSLVHYALSFSTNFHERLPPCRC